MSRLSELATDSLTDEQLAIYNDIVRTRGGSIDGPFAPWLRSPGMAEPAQKLGAFCRYHTRLPARLSELAILITAAHWRANVEWHIHAPIARREGLSDVVIDALQDGRQPSFQREDEKILYELTTQLYAIRRVSDECYRKAVAEFGEAGVVELVGILGYYALVAMTLNLFEVDQVDMDPLPFPDR